MTRHLTLDEEIFINQFSQNLHSLEEMDAWFLEHDRENQAEILHNLLNMMLQAHPTYEEIELAATKLKKRRSSAAVKLLNKTKPFSKFGYEILHLPEQEWKTVFDILLVTLSKADCR